MERAEFWNRVRRRLRVQPGDVVIGTHPKKGDIIGRVGLVNPLGGVIVDLDDGRLAGFGPDEVAGLIVVECVPDHVVITESDGHRWVRDQEPRMLGQRL